MNVRHHGMIAGICLLLASCKADPTTVYLERELRQHEDVIYKLRGVVEDQQAELQAIRSQNDGLRRQLGDDTPEPPRNGRSNGRGPAVPPPRTSRGADVVIPEGITGPSGPGTKTSPAQPVGPPRIELPNSPGQEQVPETLLPRSLKPPEGGRPAPAPLDQVPEPKSGAANGRPAPLGAARLASAAPRAPTTDSAKVDRIVLNRSSTGGYRTAGRNVDEGIALLVEPRDGQGRLVNAAASVSVVLLDRQAQGDAARLARWDFSAQDVATMIEHGQGPGIYLELPWPGAPPAHSQLQAFVRYTTSDGRKLEAQQPIDVQLAPAPATAQWNALPPGAAAKTEAPPADTAAAPAGVSSRASSAAPRSKAAAAPDAPRWSPRDVTTAAGPAKRDAAPPPSKPEPTAQRPAWSPYR